MNHTRGGAALMDISEAQICHIHDDINIGILGVDSTRFVTSHRRTGWYGISKDDTIIKLHRVLVHEK